MLDRRPNFGLAAVLSSLGFIVLPTFANPLVGEVFGRWIHRFDQCFLADLGAVFIHALFMAMQQIRQGMLVMHICCGDHGNVCQSALTVHANVQLHAEVLLLVFACLVHLGVTLPVGILG